MLTALLMAASALIGAGAVYLYSRHTIKVLRAKNRAMRAGLEPTKTKRPETSKLIIYICLIMGFSWVWCSYYLAYTNHEQIAESLSQVAVTEIIGVVLAYCVKAAIENLSKNNHWPDKAPAKPTGDGEPPPDQQDPPGVG